MKLTLITFIYLFLSTSTKQDNKSDFLCQKWRQVGLKLFGKDYKPVDKAMSELILIKKDGTYEKEIYGSIQTKGQWKFNNDSTKLAFSVTAMNNTAMKSLSLAETNPTDSIIKLTSDTLIYGALAYFGKEKIYGHIDWYFVRER